MTACKNCGAHLPEPEDPSILSVTCRYCGTQQLLPDADERRRKAEWARDDRGDRWMWNLIRAGTGIFVLAVFAFVGWRVFTAMTAAGAPSVPAGAPAPSQLPTAEPPKPSAPPVPQSTGEERMTELLRGRAADGCRRVLLPPRVVSGPRTLTASLVRGPRCVELFVVSGTETESLAVTFESPLGEPIASPAAAAEIFIRHCPTIAGAHKIAIAPTTSNPYTVAGVECPRRRGETVIRPQASGLRPR